MHRIIGGKQQQRYPYDPTGAQIISENDFFRYFGQQKIKAEEQHQRQRDKKRKFVYCIIHLSHLPGTKLQGFSVILNIGEYDSIDDF